MYLIMLFRVMNPHQRCLQDKVKHWNEPKQVMPKSQGLSRSLEIKNEHLIQNFKLCSIKHGHNYIIFKSAVKHRQLSYGYHRGQTCQTPRGYHSGYTFQYVTYLHFYLIINTSMLI